MTELIYYVAAVGVLTANNGNSMVMTSCQRSTVGRWLR